MFLSVTLSIHIFVLYFALFSFLGLMNVVFIKYSNSKLQKEKKNYNSNQ